MKPVIFFPHYYRVRSKYVLHTDRSPLKHVPRNGAPALLLAQTDEYALRLVREATRFRQLGWLLLVPSLETAVSLSNTGMLYGLAATRGVLDAFPIRYASLSRAPYPHVMKTVTGTFGQNVHIVWRQEDARTIMASSQKEWIHQELIEGAYEISTLLLAIDGCIRHAIRTEYHYDAAAYVWPAVNEILHDRTSTTELPASEANVLGTLLEGYSGICNFNYKLRKDRSIAIFECNIRAGRDITDAPLHMAEHFLRMAYSYALLDCETLDRVSTRTDW